MIIIGCCTKKKGGELEALRSRLNLYLNKREGKLIITSAQGICSAYNQIIEESLSEKNINFTVFMHDDLYILDDQWAEKLLLHFNVHRHAGIAGAIGASKLKSLEWWQNSSTAGSIHETRGFIHLGQQRQKVDAIDGCFMAVTKKAMECTKFDEHNFDSFHGYDIDYCYEASSKGIDTHVVPIDLFHATKGGLGDKESYERAKQSFYNKWLKA